MEEAIVEEIVEEIVEQAELDTVEEAIVEEIVEEAVLEAVEEAIVEEAIVEEAIVEEAVREAVEPDLVLDATDGQEAAGEVELGGWGDDGDDGEVVPVESPYDRPGRWYVVHTYSGYENKVRSNMGNVVASRGIEDRVFEVVIPMEDVVEFKGGKKVTVQKKVFPGYLLVRCDLDDDTWGAIRNTPGSPASWDRDQADAACRAARSRTSCRSRSRARVEPPSAAVPGWSTRSTRRSV